MTDKRSTNVEEPSLVEDEPVQLSSNRNGDAYAAAIANRGNGYLYQEHTQELLVIDKEWQDDPVDIHEEFTQNFVDEENMNGEAMGAPDHLTVGGPAPDSGSIHTFIDEEEERQREEMEEAERLKQPFRTFDIKSYQRLVDREREIRLKKQRNEEDEGRLVDGQIVFDDAADQELEKDAKLAEGQSLPESLGRFPRDLLSIPLEEIDPNIRDKTFVVIAKKFSKFTIFRFSAERSLFIFPPWSPIRKFCLSVISNQYFDLLILLSIIVNCVFMIVDPDPTRHPKTYHVFSIFEYIFQAVYTVEMLVKILARGFILHKHAYLRDGWNWLDFGVVVIAYVTITLEETASDGNSSVNLSGLRGLRVLRALKSISVVPGLRTIVNALLKSLKMLAEVMLLTLFCIAVFALLALQLYMGVLRQKCVADIPATYPLCNGTGNLATWSNATGTYNVTCYRTFEDFRLDWIHNSANYYTDDEGSYALCGNISDALQCESGYTCHAVGKNPNWDFTHFDNFGMAMLNTFQLVTLDFWEDTYNKIIDVNGPFNILFFMMVVLLGSFYLVNLMLAVVAMAYEQEADVEAKLAQEEEEEEKAKAKRKENTALLFDPKKLKQQLLAKHKEEEDKKRMEAMGINPDGENNNTVGDGVFAVDPNSPVKSPRLILVGGDGQPLKLSDERGDAPSPTQTQGSELTASGVQMQSPVVNRYDPELGDDEDDEDENAFHDDLPPISKKQRRYLIQKYANLWFNRIKPENQQLVDRNCLCCAKSGLPTYHGWMKLQNMVFVVVNDGLFDLFITLCIIANTIVMGTELYDKCSLCQFCPSYPLDPVNEVYGRDLSDCRLCDPICADKPINIYDKDKGMKDSHLNAMEISNVVFTLIFTVEAILKLTALSARYFKVGWNCFDLFIVVFSLPDLAIYFGDFGDIAGVSELAGIVKIFRLMRIIKLAQSWNAMKTLLGIIFNTLGALANLSAILVIIIVIFSVLGNQLLGEHYFKYEDIEANPKLTDYNGELPRWNFTDFFHSFLMVFRILCGEFIEPLWDCMRIVSEVGCTFFFLSTLILGNFMVLNLFLALLLNAFSADNLEEQAVESKMVARVKQVISLLNCRKARAITPTDKLGSQASLTSRVSRASYTSRSSRRPRTRLEMILDKGSPERPAIIINGDKQSVDRLIYSTDPHSEKLNGSVCQHSSGEDLELKPITNGHSHPSRSVSLTSILSNGSVVGNGILKNGPSLMNERNLWQIEQAFTTNRQEFAQFETAMDASAPKATGAVGKIEEDSDPKVTTVDDKEGNLRRHSIASAAAEAIEEDDEAAMVGADGEIILPDCCCARIHRNPKYNNCCSPTWKSFREVCARIVTHFLFEGFILLLIMFSSITLCFEDIYLHEKPLTVEVLSYLNIMFAVFFFIEMILKWIAFGYVKYFTSFWTILDFLIVGVSLIDIASTYGGFADISAFRTLRILRALRPLRAVSRWQNMKIVVNALIFAMPAIGNVFVVIIVFWLIFAIMGVQTFRGLFYYCQLDGDAIAAVGKYEFDNFTQAPNQYEWCIGVDTPNITFSDGLVFPTDLKLCEGNGFLETKKWPTLCEELGGDWDRQLIHFDDVGAAYLALFQVATFEGWMEVMNVAVDAPLELNNQAHREARLLWYFYFLIFIVFGAFFTLNLFIGVIIENFQVLKKKYDGSYLAAFLTDSQRNYYNTLKKLGKKKPQKTIRRPKTKFLAFFFDIAVNTKFEIAITIIIFLNMIVMMCDALPPADQLYDGFIDENGSYTLYHQDKIDHRGRVNEGLEIINLIFTLTFVVEAIIKILGLRLHYFRRAWNVFDFVVVMLSVIGIVMEQLLSGDMFISPTLLRVVRVFRIGRVLRLVKSAKGIRKLIFALLISIPALFNIFLLLFIFMFIYAVVGMTLFSQIRKYEALGETVNFETFGRSMLLLFRLATSAGWNDVIQPIQEDRFCNSTHYIDTLGVPNKSATGDCGISWLAIVYFLSYLFLSFMIIVNMYIAVILENFTQAHEAEEIGITEDDFDMFYVIWENYDPLATQYIKLEQLSAFLDDLEEPLGIPKPNGMAIVSFNLPIVEGDRIHCLDVLMALVRRVLHTSDEETPNMSDEHKEANEKLKSQIAEKYRSAFPQRQKAKVLSTTMQRKKEDVAAKTLQRAWRKHRMKQNIMRIKELALDSTQRGSISHKLHGLARVGSAGSHRSRPGSGKSVDSRRLGFSGVSRR